MSLDNGVLRIQATQGHDRIRVDDHDGVLNVVILRIPGYETIFSDTVLADQVNQILIFGLAGDDSISLVVHLPVTIVCGRGNDWVDCRTCFAGAAIEGQHGDDTIMGGPADDTVSGGIGNDTIFTYRGLDTIDGGPGQDVIAPNVWDMTGVVSDGEADIVAGGSGADDFYVVDEDVLLDFADEDFILP